jgi:hypothetical protein
MNGSAMVRVKQEETRLSAKEWLELRYDRTTRSQDQKGARKPGMIFRSDDETGSEPSN